MCVYHSISFPNTVVKCPIPLKNRDFVNQRSWRMYSEDQFVVFNHSVQHHVSDSNSAIDVWIIYMCIYDVIIIVNNTLHQFYYGCGPASVAYSPCSSNTNITIACTGFFKAQRMREGYSGCSVCVCLCVCLLPR